MKPKSFYRLINYIDLIYYLLTLLTIVGYTSTRKLVQFMTRWNLFFSLVMYLISFFALCVYLKKDTYKSGMHRIYAGMRFLVSLCYFLYVLIIVIIIIVHPSYIAQGQEVALALDLVIQLMWNGFGLYLSTMLMNVTGTFDLNRRLGRVEYDEEEAEYVSVQ